MFKLAALSPRVKRVYFYHWSPAPTPDATWDSALVDAHDQPRPAYDVLYAWLRQARHRALVALALALALAGCGASKDEGISGGGKVIGRTVTVYSLTSDPGGAGRDFVDGEKLALADAGGRAGALAVNFTSLDLGGADDKLQAQAARRAISDPQIIAAIVDATPVTVPLFNAAGILQVAAERRPEPRARPAGAARPASTRSARCRRRPRRPTSTRASEATFGRDPAPSAAGRATARCSGVLQAIADAGAAGNDRTRVIDAYFNLALEVRLERDLGDRGERLRERAARLGALRGLLEAVGVQTRAPCRSPRARSW